MGVPKISPTDSPGIYFIVTLEREYPNCVPTTISESPGYMLSTSLVLCEKFIPIFQLKSFVITGLAFMVTSIPLFCISPALSVRVVKPEVGLVLTGMI